MTADFAELGRSLAAWVVSANLQAAALLALAAAADWALARRLSAAWRIALYAAVLARVLTPTSAVWSVPGWDAARPTAPHAAGWTLTLGPAVRAPGGPAAVALSPWWSLAPALYTAGVLALAARWALDARRAWAHASNARGTVVRAGLVGPMVVGVWRPRIVLPEWLTGQEAALVLAHERAHVERRDPALAALVRAACVALWPVAAVWVAGSRVRGLMEQACDERVVEQGGGKEHRMMYARTMIDVAERAAGFGGHPAGSLAFGASLRSRIAALRPAARWPRRLQAAAALAVPALLLACSAARPAQTGAMGAVGRGVPGEILPSPAPAIPGGPAPQIAEDLDTTRTITVRVADIDPVEVGMAEPGSGVVVRAGERSEFSPFYGPGFVGQFLSAPTVMVSLGQEAQVEVGTGEGSILLRLVVWPSDTGTTLMGVGFQETVGERLIYDLPPINVNFPSAGEVMVRVPGDATHRARTLLITVGFSPEANNPGC